MAWDLTQLANHLDGLIVLADAAWRGPIEEICRSCMFVPTA
jgi:hypothetical protein